MTYIFEDNGKDVFSVLFRHSYPEEVRSKFVYAEGAPNIGKRAEPLLANGEGVIAFMDLVPGNRELIRVYDDLNRLSKKYSHRLAVVVIPCIEYEFIRSVQGLVNNKFVERCVAYEPYLDLASEFDISDNLKTFEKYCKAVIKSKMHLCMSTDDKHSKYARVFYNEDCKYSSLLDKSAALLKQFPIIPIGIDIDSYIRVTNDVIWNIHRQSIDEYNDAVDRFREAGVKANKAWYIK